MKITLTYDLPEDYKDALAAVKVGSILSFLWDYQNYLRSQWKYAEKPDDIDTIYNKWFEMMREGNVDLDNLIE